MHKRVVEGSPVGTYFVWEMPEIAKKIPQLFKEAGNARVVGAGSVPQIVIVEVLLKEPAKVVDWRKELGDGLAINSDTNAIIGAITGSASVILRKLPHSGDTKIVFTLWLELHTFNETDRVSPADLEEKLRQMAKLMKKTWYYHFK
jgi:hypothetical protein